MSLCLICLSEVDNYITCHDPECKNIVCHDCAKDYIEHSASENRLPQCPTSDCNNLYLLSTIKKLNDERVEKIYKKACYDYFMLKSKKDIEEYIVYQNIIDKIREERKNFIRGEFPAAITLVINIALKTKLNKINKKNKAFGVIKDKSSRSCMISYCNGKLDENMICIKCESEFCKKCEKIININHVCKQTDIESVSFINLMVRCPNCSLPVQKSEGCNAITCAVCNTNFDYVSGEPSLLGNHGANIMFKVADYNILSNVYSEQYSNNCIKIMQEIESNKPPSPDMESITKILKKIYLKEDLKNYTELAIAFEKTCIKKYKYTEYIKIYSSIEEHHSKSTLNNKRLNEILEKCKFIFSFKI